MRNKMLTLTVLTLAGSCGRTDPSQQKSIVDNSAFYHKDSNFVRRGSCPNDSAPSVKACITDAPGSVAVAKFFCVDDSIAKDLDQKIVSTVSLRDSKREEARKLDPDLLALNRALLIKSQQRAETQTQRNRAEADLIVLRSNRDVLRAEVANYKKIIENFEALPKTRESTDNRNYYNDEMTRLAAIADEIEKKKIPPMDEKLKNLETTLETLKSDIDTLDRELRRKNEVFTPKSENPHFAEFTRLDTLAVEYKSMLSSRAQINTRLESGLPYQKHLLEGNDKKYFENYFVPSFEKFASKCSH